MVWGNIGDDISLFLCDEGTAELTICDFKSLIPLLLVLSGAFCALLFAGHSFVCVVVCAVGLSGLFMSQFIAAVSAKIV